MQLLKFKCQLIKIKYNFKFSALVMPVPFEGLNRHGRLGALLGSAESSIGPRCTFPIYRCETEAQSHRGRKGQAGTQSLDLLISSSAFLTRRRPGPQGWLPQPQAQPYLTEPWITHPLSGVMTFSITENCLFWPLSLSALNAGWEAREAEERPRLMKGSG